jgi:hypothetical protein
MLEAKRTHNHDEIKKWVEDRGGKPAMVKLTEDHAGGGMLRIDFGEKEESLDAITWVTFFRLFEDRSLDFLCQDESASRFFKFVDRES